MPLAGFAAATVVCLGVWLVSSTAGFAVALVAGLGWVVVVRVGVSRVEHPEEYAGGFTAVPPEGAADREGGPTADAPANDRWRRVPRLLLVAVGIALAGILLSLTGTALVAALRAVV